MKLKILIGGGDGSVLSTIEDLFNEKINLEKCIFGAIPLGTGNDLSNAMGFDSTCEIGIKIEYFQRVLYTYLIASTIKIDIWNLKLKVDKNEGRIYDIISNGEIELKDEIKIKENKINQLKIKKEKEEKIKMRKKEREEERRRRI